MNKKTFVFAFFCLFIFSVFSQKHYNTDSLFLEMENRIQKNTGHPFFNFQAKTLDGKLYTEKDLIGKVTFINFWFELCSPCIAEFGALNELFAKFKNNAKFQFLSFTRDSPEETRISVEKYHLPYTVFSISERECYRLNCNSGFPTTIIINEKGKMIYIKTGGSMDQQQIKDDIHKIATLIERNLDRI